MIFQKLFALSSFISIAATEIALGVLIAILIKKLIKKEIFLKDFPFGIFFLIFIILVDISFIYKFFYLHSMKFSLKKLFQGWLFLSFFCGYFLVKDEDIFKYFIISAIVSISYGIFSQYFIFHTDVKGFYSHALTSANNWAMAGLISYFLAINNFKKDGKKFWFYTVSSLIIFTGLLFSMRRGPILYFFIVIFLMNFFINKKLIVINFLIIIAMIIAYFKFPYLKEKTNEIFSKKKEICSSTETRIFLWKKSLEFIKKYPFFGVPEKFKKMMSKETDVKCWIRSHPHNGFLTIATYYGVPALIIFLSLFIAMYKKLFEHLKENKFSLLGIFLITLYLLEGLTENNFGDSEVKIFFWFSLGVIFKLLNKPQLTSISHS